MLHRATSTWRRPATGSGQSPPSSQDNSLTCTYHQQGCPQGHHMGASAVTLCQATLSPGLSPTVWSQPEWRAAPDDLWPASQSLHGPRTLSPTHSLAGVEPTPPGPGTRSVPGLQTGYPGEGCVCEGDTTALSNQA